MSTRTWAEARSTVLPLPRLRHCTRCGEGYPPTAEHFHRNPATRDGLDPWCKGCKQARARRRYVEGPDRERSRGRARARAVALLQRRHADEWRSLYAAELEAEGL